MQPYLQIPGAYAKCDEKQNPRMSPRGSLKALQNSFKDPFNFLDNIILR